MKRIRRISSANRGFALIITVLLLALLMLVLVSTATLTQIETSIGHNSRRQAQAQQNALYALNRALGELQRHAGPDQRITATASILGDGNPNFSGNDFDNNANWTAVWNSDGSGLRTWLVSGNEDAPDGATLTWRPNIPVSGLRTDMDATTPVTLNGVAATTLVGPNSAGTTGTNPTGRYVVAPLENLTATGADGTANATVGRYAWWIGDEGVKASANEWERQSKVSLTDTVTGDNYANPDTNARTAQLALPRQRFDAIATGMTYNPTIGDQLSHVLTRSQISFVTGAPGAVGLRKYFHDITTWSRGVLVNTNLGGLKSDLTFPNDSTVDPRMREYLLRRPVSNSGTVARFAISGSPANGWVAPVLTEARFVIHFLPAVSGNIPVQCFWDVKLWNPYNVELQLRPLDVRLINTGTITISPALSNGIVDLLQTFSKNKETGLVFRVQIVKYGDATKTWQAEFPESGILKPGQILSVESGVTQSDGSGNALANSSGGAIMVGASYSVGGTISASDTDGALAFQLWDPTADVEIARYRPHSGAFNVGSASNDAYLAYRFRLKDSTDDEPENGALADSWLAQFDPRNSSIKYFDFAPLAKGPLDSGVPNCTITSAASGEPKIDLHQVNNKNNTVVAFDLPVQQQVSIGALQHYMFPLTATASENPHAFRLCSTWAGVVKDPFDSTQQINANDLFDRAYFSTVPRASTTWKAGIDPLPNTRMEIYSSDPGSPVDADTLISDGAKSNDRLTAAHLLVRGAFNLNSTSSNAWKILVGGARVDGWNYFDGSVSANPAAPPNHAFFRLPSTAQSIGVPFASTPSISNTTGWRQGIRELSDNQVNGIASFLAQHIDDEAHDVGGNVLKGSGFPFRSIADFVNAHVSIAGKGWRPLLQEAIDESDGGSINSGLDRLSAGFLTAADLMNAWAPFLQARSDTFVVRTYGEAVNPATGVTEARAWGEAIVQRVPDYVDSANSADAVSGLTATNTKFGRRFKVVQFRWLSPADI